MTESAAEEDFADRMDAALLRLREGDSEALREVVGGSERLGIAHEFAALTNPTEPLAPGASFGEFEILHRLGQGGMGIVYAARQKHPDRRVALKLVRAGSLASDLELRWFQREARALAQLEHPGIARLYAVGQEAGLPYFAMELVEGIPLLEYAEARSLSVRQRLELICDLLDAVDFAHRRGVIHLDLKPSNVLVTPEGRVRVLDFGFARFLDHGEGDPRSSIPPALAGTLPYMAPEQVQGDDAKIDTRTDVYGLGVVLYESLTGELPFRVSRARLLASVQKIVETDPRRPSEVDAAIDRDLDAIIGMAMAREPGHRYSGVAALAEDVRRYLSGFPIVARQPSVFGRLWKLARRRRSLALAVSVALFGLIAGGGGMIVALVQARQAEQEARAQTRQARTTVELLTDILTLASPELRARKDMTVREFLDAAAAEQSTRYGSDPAVRAALDSAIGRAYLSLGSTSAARQHLERALEVRRALHVTPHVDLAQSLRDLAFFCHATLDYERAHALHGEALAMRKEVLEEPHEAIGQSRVEMAELALARGRNDAAVALARENVDALQAAAPAATVELTRRMIELGRILIVADQLAAGLEALEAAKRICPKAQRHWRLISRLHRRLADGYHRDADIEAARRVLMENAAYLRRELGTESLELAATYVALGHLPATAADPQPLNQLERGLRIQVARLSARHPVVLQTRAGLCARIAGRDGLPAAIREWQSLLEDTAAAMGADHIDVGKVALSLAEVHLSVADFVAADAALVRTEAVYRDKPIDVYSRIRMRYSRARITSVSQPKVGARQLRRVEEELCREYEPGSPFRAATLVKITRDRIDLGAEPLGMAALQADREVLLRSPNQLLAAELELAIGESLFVLGKVEAARKSLARGLTMKPSAAARERALRVLAKIDGR